MIGSLKRTCEHPGMGGFPFCAHCGGRVPPQRECPECGEIFLKLTRKVYCTTRCQGRVGMRNWRAKLKIAKAGEQQG